MRDGYLFYSSRFTSHLSLEPYFKVENYSYQTKIVNKKGGKCGKIVMVF